MEVTFELILNYQTRDSTLAMGVDIEVKTVLPLEQKFNFTSSKRLIKFRNSDVIGKKTNKNIAFRVEK